jgi:hypothetical protein
MRALIHLDIRKDVFEASANKDSRSIVRDFLSTTYLPTAIQIPREAFDGIMQIDRIHADDGNLQAIFDAIDKSLESQDNGDLALRTNTSNDLKNAVRVLSTIPKEPNQERSNALVNAAFSISCHVKEPSGTFVPGVVSIRENRVEVRFRHHNAKALEEATKQFVQDVWKAMGAKGPFAPFAKDATVAIREPFSLENVNVGTIHAPVSIMSRVRETILAHVPQASVCFASFLICAVFAVLSYKVVRDVKNEESVVRRAQLDPEQDNGELLILQWRQGWYDRLASTGFITFVYSFVELATHFVVLYRIPTIRW